MIIVKDLYELGCVTAVGEQQRARGWLATHTWLPPWGQWDGHPAGTERAAPYLLGHFYHSSSQSPATVSVFRSVISLFCAALSDRGCAVTIWTNSQNGAAPPNLSQLVIYDKLQCSISSLSAQWSDLEAFCHFLSLKVSADFNGAFPGEDKWKFQAISKSAFLARITPLLTNNWQPQGCQYHPGVNLINLQNQFTQTNYSFVNTKYSWLEN